MRKATAEFWEARNAIVESWPSLPGGDRQEKLCPENVISGEKNLAADRFILMDACAVR